MQFVGGVLEVADEGSFDGGVVYALWANPGQAVDLRVAQYFGVGDGLVDACVEFFDPVRVAGNPALALGPIAGGQVEQHLGQFVGFQVMFDFFSAVVVRKQVFNAVETSVGSRLETDKEILFGEQHGQVGGKTRHGELLLFCSLSTQERARA